MLDHMKRHNSDQPITSRRRKHKKVLEEEKLVDVVTGNDYEQDPKRKFACLVPGCLHRFTRFYDLNRHYQSVHPTLNTLDESLQMTHTSTLTCHQDEMWQHVLQTSDTTQPIC
jgi:hypothetical protein